MIVAALLWTSKPASPRDTSFATMMSTSFVRNLARPRATTSLVSAANPTSTGEDRPRPGARDLRQDIRCPGQRHGQAVAIARQFLRLWSTLDRVVRDGRSHDQRVRIGDMGQHGRPHLRRASDPHHLGRVWRRQRRRSRHEHHTGAARDGFLGEREPHSATRAIADVSHRVEVLVRRSSRHHH